MEEKAFTNGNMSKVYLKDGKIYRSLKPYSKIIHRLLKHLEEKEIAFVPRFLGIDEESKMEILSFVNGESLEDYCGGSSLNEKCERISKVGSLLRIYHDATVDFKFYKDDKWFLEYKGDLAKEVICHNDVAPYNMTFIYNEPVGIIDFDTACPAPRVWDIAYALYRFVPLGREVYDGNKKSYRNYEDEIDANERKILIKYFLEGYGWDNTLEVLENVILRLEALVSLFDKECENGNEAFIKMRDEGHQKFYIDEIAFIKKNMREWI